MLTLIGLPLAVNPPGPLQLKLRAPVPPDAVAVRVALEPAHTMALLTVRDSAGGWVIDTLVEAAQPWASVTVKL